jgi:hypothetical protein
MSISTTEIADEEIREYPPREQSRYVDYKLGKISVCYRGGDQYLCGTCSWPDNYATADHKGCAHIARIVKYREEHAA